MAVIRSIISSGVQRSIVGIDLHGLICIVHNIICIVGRGIVSVTRRGLACGVYYTIGWHIADPSALYYLHYLNVAAFFRTLVKTKI